MNRRGFLRFLGAGAAVATLGGAELADLLLPKPTIFLPPAGGWASGNTLLSLQELSREALRILERNLKFANLSNTAWTPSRALEHGERVITMCQSRHYVSTRLPPRYAVRGFA